MNWLNVRLIFLREVRDQLRDRRTLFMIAVLPLLLYPALGIGMLRMTLLFTEQPRTVVILGEQHLPSPQLLEGDRFVTNWFTNPADADKLKVVTDTSVELGGGGMSAPRNMKLIEQARALRSRVEQHTALQDELKPAEETLRKRLLNPSEPAAEPLAELQQRIARLKAKQAAIDHELTDLFASSQIQVLIVVPDGLRDNIERVNRLIAERQTVDTDLQYPRPTIVKNRADDKSVVAFARVREVLEAWEEEILRQRLSAAELPEELTKPVGSAPLDLAAEEQLSANVWSKMFPALLVIMAVTGAFYPAVDVAAGEKERGTMETLLICPATRTEIVLGKFFTVMGFSMSTALLNLLSIGATGQYMLSVAGGTGKGAFANAGVITLPTAPALAWLLILLVPLSAFFSAMCLALATFARSSKEGQYYLTPLLMVSIGLTVFCLSPAVEIYPVHQASWFYSIMPVVNIALLLKALLLNPGNTEALIFAGPVLATSIGYSLLALWWAIEQFSSEGVLFRDGERFEPGLWLRHLLRDKEPTPTFTEAGFCFVLMMLAQFVSMRAMNQSILSAPPDQAGVRMLKLLVIQQLATIACPALFMALILTTSVRQTLKLRLPNWKFLAVAVVLPFALHPLSVELVNSLHWFFPQLPEGVLRQLKLMGDGDQPLWLLLIAFAVAPPLCEELAFRGFILTGLCRDGRTRLAIVLSALTFGVMHTFTQQVFNATLLGIVLGLIAIRSNSLLPGIVFHMLFNSLPVLRERVLVQRITGHAEEFRQSFWSSFATLDDGGLHYTRLTLLLSGAVASACLWWVWQAGRTRSNSNLAPPATTSLTAGTLQAPTL
jgi:sodium transport system permease protein